MWISKKVFGIGLLLLSIGSPMHVWAQVNISGKPGLIYIPTARLFEDGKFHFGVNYNPINYAFRFNPDIDPRAKTRNSENIYFLNVAILPRLELNINLLRPNGYILEGANGIGDRQIDLKYILLTQGEKRPALAIILSAPFGGDNSLITNAIVATKDMSITKNIDVELTIGTGTPYHIAREEVKNLQNSNIFSDLMISNNPKRYLTGPFGGINIRIKKRVGLMAEWDSHHLNLGAYATLFNHWTLQGGVLNFDQVTLGTSYAFSLLKLPKRVSGTLVD